MRRFRQHGCPIVERLPRQEADSRPNNARGGVVGHPVYLTRQVERHADDDDDDRNPRRIQTIQRCDEFHGLALSDTVYPRLREVQGENQRLIKSA